jgi:hypothetical protein
MAHGSPSVGKFAKSVIITGINGTALQGLPLSSSWAIPSPKPKLATRKWVSKSPPPMVYTFTHECVRNEDWLPACFLSSGTLSKEYPVFFPSRKRQNLMRGSIGKHQKQ